MYFYEVSVLGKRLDALTYHSYHKLNPLDEINITVSGKKRRGIVLRECGKPSFETICVGQPTGRRLSTHQYELAVFISEYYGVGLSIVLDIFELDFAPASEISLDDKNHQTSASNERLASDASKCQTPFNGCYEREDSNAGVLPTNEIYRTNITLSPNQQKAYDFALQNQISLIFGDTGSGKSEIYFRLIEKTINEGAQALFLMPEIALTASMQKRVEQHFGDDFIVYHSRLTPTQKRENLSKLVNKQAKIVLGARSALFLPYHNLRLIIVDEEHDGSYKSSSSPFYNARDLAIWHAKNIGAKLVLGSATPSLSSYHKYPSFRLKGTYHLSAKSYIYDNSQYGISRVVLEQIKASLDNDRQVIVFAPNRANFRQLECKSCHERVFCPFCDIPLSVHLKSNILKCHYCNYASGMIRQCPNCQSDMLEAQKIGTAQIVDELSRCFCDHKIVKLDSDEITSNTKLNKILADFGERKINVLVGTQMVSKGHDYLNVDLAVILGLDEYLFYPSYLAKEHTLSLCKQIAGRAGRSGDARVLIQTHHQRFFEKYIDDYELFLKDEMDERGDYPPFSRLLFVLISHTNERRANDNMGQILAQLSKLKSRINVVGYGKSAVYIINRHFRYQILIKSHSYKTLSAIAKYANSLEGVKADMDPINFI